MIAIPSREEVNKIHVAALSADDAMASDEVVAALDDVHAAMADDEKSAIVLRLNAIPVVDAVEVVHASPVRFYSDPFTGRMFTTCSPCDGKIGPKDTFCKHCGAHMDGQCRGTVTGRDGKANTESLLDFCGC